MTKLNKQQRIAAYTSKRIVYVDAGPGCGKTTVIEARVQYLISINVAPREILVLAFNTKVVNELKKRLRQFMGIDICTFHSLGLSIIKQNSRNYEIEILSDDEKSKLVTRIKKLLSLQTIPNNEILEMLNACRENPRHLKKYSADLQRIYKDYVKHLKQEKLFDYPKLISRANAILKKKHISMYKHILVDEFQDTSQNRFKLLRLLIGNDANLFAVGDGDQQILEWAGVRNNNLRKLQKYYSDLKIYPLEGSYRLTLQITKVANNLIQHSKKRMNKTLKPLNQQNGHFEVKQFDDSDNEAKWCVNKINFLLRNGVDKKDIAVLVRMEKMLYDTVKKTGVICSTIHKAKGLEFTHVIVLGAEEGIFSGSIDEERRILYVAITRAIKSLTLTYIDDGIRMIGSIDKRVKKSPLLDELYK